VGIRSDRFGNPVKIGETLFSGGTVGASAMHWPYIYFVGRQVEGEGYRIGMIDVFDPTNPILHAQVYDPVNYSISIVMDSTYLYIGEDIPNFADAVRIYDWDTNPLTPTEVGYLNPFARPNRLALFYPDTTGVKLAVNCDVIGNQDDTLAIYDVSDPTAITLIGPPLNYEYDMIWDMAINSYWLCFIGHTDPNLYELNIYKFVGPGITGYAKVDLPFSARSIDLDWPDIFCTSGSTVLAIDAGNPQEPVPRGSLVTNEGFMGGDIAAADGTVVIRHENGGLEFYDFSDIDNPVKTTEFEYINQVYAGYVFDFTDDNDYLVFSEFTSGDKGITTLDITDPWNLEVLNRFSTQYAFNLKRQDNLFAGSGITGSDAYLFQNWSPTLITELCEVPEVLNSMCVGAIDGDYLYTVDRPDGHYYDLGIFNISNTSNPVLVDSLDLGEQVLGVVPVPGYLYVHQESGLSIYDNADPNNPVLDGWVTSGTVNGAFIDGEHLYVCEPDLLSIFSLTDPGAPILEGTTDLGGSTLTNGVRFKQFMLMVGPDDPDVHVVRVWPASDPEHLGTFYGYLGGENLVVNDGYLYLLTKNAGLRIFRL